MNARILFSHRARRLFFFVHLWIGLSLGLWFALIGVTGSVLAWRGELNGIELARRYPPQKPAANAEIIPLSQAVAAMKKAHPDATAKELATVTLPNRKMPFYSFSRGRNRATMQTILIDPYSAQVHPPVRMRTLWVGTIQQFHQRLIAGAKGYLVNGFFNFLAVPLLLSGLWLWWPTKLKHLKAHLVVKRGVSLKRTVYDLHNVLGIYLYPLLLITTLTGAMLVQQHVSADGGIVAFLKEDQATTLRQSNQREGREREGRKPEAPGAAEAAPRGREASEAPTVEPQNRRFSEDELVAMARQKRPQFELTRIQLPQRPDQVAQLTFAKAAGFNLSETVYLNPYNGEEIVSEQTQAAPARSPLRQWTRVLHLGEFGGVFSKLIYTITGLMPLGLFATGALLWWRKKSRQLAARKSDAKELSRG